MEGVADEAGLRVLVDRLDPENRSPVRIWAAGGQLAVPSLVRRLRESGLSNVAVIVEPDIEAGVMDELGAALAQESWRVVVVAPNISGSRGHAQRSTLMLFHPPQ